MALEHELNEEIEVEQKFGKSYKMLGYILMIPVLFFIIAMVIFYTCNKTSSLKENDFKSKEVKKDIVILKQKEK